MDSMEYVGSGSPENALGGIQSLMRAKNWRGATDAVYNRERIISNFL